jgi:AcrR family transcriptional regulator
MQANVCFHGFMAARRSRGLDSRERVLAAARARFAAHGFAAVTMREIGEAAGLDNSSLYRHFRSKTELANAVLDRAAGEILALLSGALAPADPPTLEALADAAGRLGSALFDRPELARLIVHWVMSRGESGAVFSVGVRADDPQRPAGRLVLFVRQWLARAERARAIRRHADPDALVILIGALVLRPATHGHLLASLEPRRSRASARAAFERELRAVVRGAFTP